MFYISYKKWVVDMSAVQDNGDIESLKKKIKDKEMEINVEREKASNGILGGILIMILSLIGAYFLYNKRNLMLNIIFYILIIFALICFAVAVSSYYDSKSSKFKEIELASLIEELELEQIPNQNIIVRADKQLKINQKDLQRYYDLNLSQTKFLSKLGIALILFGLVTISISIFLYLNVKDDLWLLLVGTISGILIDFVGAIFITMYTKNLDASVKFHSKLAGSNNLLLANSIATKIGNESLRESTLAEIAKGIACSSSD